MAETSFFSFYIIISFSDKCNISLTPEYDASLIDRHDLTIRLSAFSDQLSAVSGLLSVASIKFAPAVCKASYSGRRGPAGRRGRRVPQFAVFDHQNLVGDADGAETVSDHNGCTVNIIAFRKNICYTVDR